jgi:hypothetical protein
MSDAYLVIEYVLLCFGPFPAVLSIFASTVLPGPQNCIKTQFGFLVTFEGFYFCNHTVLLE